MSLSAPPVFAFVLEIGPHLEGAVLGSFLIVTVGGYVGAWRRDGAPKRSVDSLLFGDDERHDRGGDRDDGREASGRGAADPD